MMLLKIAAQYWPLISCYRAARKIRNYVFFLHRSRPTVAGSCRLTTPADDEEEEEGGGGRDDDDDSAIVVSDFCGSLLRAGASTPFPYFMLVAFEGGSLLRALLLLLSSPLLCAIGYHSQLISIKIMLFITFCGLRVKDMDLVARAVLPKFYLDNLHLDAYEALLMQQQLQQAHKGRGRRVVVFSTSLPRVMVAGFLKEYLGVDEVVGMELNVLKGGCYFSGLLSSGAELKHEGLKQHFEFGETSLADHVGSYNKHDHLSLSHCKEVYNNIVSSSKEERNSSSSSSSSSTILTRDKYPKPLIFHDSRLAFLPTPLSSLALFLFLPLLIPLSVARIFLGIVPPYKLIFPIAALTGTRFRSQTSSSSSSLIMSNSKAAAAGVLYVCNHRTLLDPVMLAAALQRPIPAVTYSVSPLSEAIAPMRTVRLTRNRETDARTMAQLLKEGNLTLCPEGTTCREPYLLRFSPLFAEVADRIVPAAMDAQGSWFYGTTASGLKSLDPLIFFMNPTPTYRVRLLDELPEELTCAGGAWTASEVANRIQKQLGDALGFDCTSFTRKDKYMMLAGNEGTVRI